MRSAATGTTLVNTIGFARREVVGEHDSSRRRRTAPARVVDADDEVRVDGLTLENAHLRATLAEDGTARSASSTRRPGARHSRRRETARALRRRSRSRSTHGTSTRTRSAPARPRRQRRRTRSRRSPLRARDRVRAAAAAAAGRAARRRARGGSSSTRGRLAREPHAAEGLLPARRPRAERRPTRCRSATRSGRRTTRRAGTRARYEVPGAPLRRPLRARLRRRAAERLEVRLQLLRQRAAAEPAALAEEPRSRRPTWDATRSRTRCCRTPAAGATPASSPRRRAFNAPLRWTTAAGRVVRGRRRPEPRARHDQAGGGLRRARAAAVRGARRPRASRGSASASPFGSRYRANALEDDGEPLSPSTARSSIPYRPHEIVTVKVATRPPARSHSSMFTKTSLGIVLADDHAVRAVHTMTA